MKSVLDVTVSCFANFKKPDNPKPINLLSWLKSNKYANICENIRNTSDKKERDRIKATLPAITPSGEFTRRENGALIKHSNLICLDIDPKGNERISNYKDLKRELSKICNVAFCGLSVSGTGFFLLIPVEHPEQHKRHFAALRYLLQDHFGVLVDSTGDVSRLRGYSYDPDGYFNHNAKPFKGLYMAPLISNHNTTDISVNDEVLLINRCINLVNSAGEGERHNQLLKASRLVGGYIAGGILSENLAVQTLYDVVNKWPNTAKSQSTIRDGIRFGKEAPLYNDASYKKIIEGNIQFEESHIELYVVK